MKAIVLAGGLGTRLREAVPDLPKPMAQVAGRPFLAYVLDALAEGGITDVVLSVGYRWEAIRNHFGTHHGSASLTYAVETEPLGTGGAIAHAFASAGMGSGESALVLNGDTFLDLNFREVVAWCASAPGQVGMVLRAVDDTARYGSVILAGGMVAGFAEKGRSGPGFINAGVYTLPTDIFARFGLTGRFSLETDLLQRHCAALRPRAWPTEAYFIDIGIPEDFARAQVELPLVARQSDMQNHPIRTEAN